MIYSYMTKFKEVLNSQKICRIIWRIWERNVFAPFTLHHTYTWLISRFLLTLSQLRLQHGAHSCWKSAGDNGSRPHLATGTALHTARASGLRAAYRIPGDEGRNHNKGWLTISRICMIVIYLCWITLTFLLPLSLSLPYSCLTSAHNKDRTLMICCWPERITIHLPAVAVRTHTIMRPFWMPNRCCPTRLVYPIEAISSYSQQILQSSIYIHIRRIQHIYIYI